MALKIRIIIFSKTRFNSLCTGLLNISVVSRSRLCIHLYFSPAQSTVNIKSSFIFSGKKQTYI